MKNADRVDEPLIGFVPGPQSTGQTGEKLGIRNIEQRFQSRKVALRHFRCMRFGIPTEKYVDLAHSTVPAPEDEPAPARFVGQLGGVGGRHLRSGK